MKPIFTPLPAVLRRMCRVLAAAVLAAGASRVGAQDYTFRVDAPREVLLGEGRTPGSFQASCQLEIAAGAAGVEGWSVSVAVEGPLAITAATTDGTIAAEVDAEPPGLRDGGFESTELGSADGIEGAVSGVILSFYPPVTLDAGDSPCRILALTIEARGEGEGRVYFLDGLRGSGEALRNVVTVGGFDVAPELIAHEVAVSAPVLIPDIEVPATIDFGTVAAGSAASRTLAISNTGAGTLRLASILLDSEASLDFQVEATPTALEVAPGAAVDVVVRYAPAGEGSDIAALVISSDDPDEPTVSVVLSGQGREGRFAGIDGPEAVDFGKVAVGYQLQLTVELMSTGMADLEIHAIELRAGSSTAFSVASVPAQMGFAPGTTFVVEVAFSPAGGGTMDGTLVISSNAQDAPELTVALSGAGVSADSAAIEADPAVLDFGRVPLGRVRTLAVRVANLAGEAVELSVIAIADTVGGAFAFSGQPPAGSIPADGEVAIAVAFAPLRPGPRRSAVRIETASGATLIVPLVGYGVTDDAFRRGDANADGRIDMSDPINVLRHLFLGGFRPPCLDAADADDSGVLQITDAVLLLRFLFNGGGPPAAPHRECGSDVRDDSFPRCGYPSVGCER